MLKPNFIMGVLAGLLFCDSVRAQDKYSEDLTVLTLAQQCVGEIDYVSESECWLMWHINASLTRAKQKQDPDWHLVDQLRAYNSAFKVETARTAWVRELNLEGTKPLHWSNTASWDRARPRWLALLERARDFLEEPGRHPCPSANAYGGRCEGDKPANANGACDKAPSCWVQVVCHSRKQRPFAQAYYVARRCEHTKS